MLSRREDAFTLIELVIGMVLLGLMLGTVLTMVMTSRDSSGSASARQKAQAQADTITRKLTDDLRATISPDRADPDLISTRDELKLHLAVAPLSIAEQLALMDGTSNTAVDPQDILRATPTELVLRSSSVPGTGRSGCIRWAVVSGGSSSSLVRTTYPDWRLCSGSQQLVMTSGEWDVVSVAAGNVVSETVAKLRVGASTDVFSYRLYEVTGPGTCATVSTRPPSMSDWQFENRLAAVKVDMDAFAENGALAGVQRSRALVTIGARTSDQYLYAMGCRV